LYFLSILIFRFVRLMLYLLQITRHFFSPKSDIHNHGYNLDLLIEISLQITPQTQQYPPDFSCPTGIG